MAAGGLAAAVDAQAETTQNFLYTGGEQSVVVPQGANEAEIVAVGGRGGSSASASGGAAAEVRGTLSVTPGETLYVEVGGGGHSAEEGGAGGFNGGGSVGHQEEFVEGAKVPKFLGGGGGGASDVRTTPRSTALNELTRLIVAGGGGGGGGTCEGGDPGGAGGAAGQDGGNELCNNSGGGGEAGGQERGGAGTYPGACGFLAEEGGLGVGGNASGAGLAGGGYCVGAAGGGAGSGFYGGGGGSGGSGGGGGGGGSSLVPPTGASTLAASGTEPHIQITLRAAAYTQQGPALPSSGRLGLARVGTSVAASADGNTAVVGAPGDHANVGAAFVFTRSGSTWSQQAKLTATGETGAGLLGDSVSISADGNTVVAGAPGDNAKAGAAFVFTRSGSAWTQPGGKLTGTAESGKAAFGSAVAISSDASAIVAGGPADGGEKGAVWAFTRSGSSWTQLGEKLIASNEGGTGRFGSHVALSSTGATALIGAPADGGNTGAAWVFSRPGSTFAQQTKLTGSGEAGKGQAGSSVALSADGNTALVGARADDSSLGAAFVFTRTGGTWSQQGSKLSGSGETTAAHFGASVALSSSGNRALIGAYGDHGGTGAAFQFERANSTWSQLGAKFTDTEAAVSAQFGYSVALSADATTVLSGGPGKGGAAWVFVLPPSSTPAVTSVSPNEGPAEGNTRVTITGSGFTGASVVLFGSKQPRSWTLNSSNSITAVSPAGRGTVDVTVTTLWGTNSATPGDHFTYVGEPPPIVSAVIPSSGPAAGGTTVEIHGEELNGATAVEFGSTPATSYVVESSTLIRAVSPAESAGTVDVRVTTPVGTSPVRPEDDHFKFGPPTVTSLAPKSGTTSGGTSVTVSGTGFAVGNNTTVFTFGKTAAASSECSSMTSCAVIAPSHPAGTVNVTATVAGQSSPSVAADRYKYS
jgi:hypothetical protein